MGYLTDDDGVWKSAHSFRISTRPYGVPEMVMDTQHFSSIGTRRKHLGIIFKTAGMMWSMGH